MLKKRLNHNVLYCRYYAKQKKSNYMKPFKAVIYCINSLRGQFSEGTRGTDNFEYMASVIPL